MAGIFLSWRKEHFISGPTTERCAGAAVLLVPALSFSGGNALLGFCFSACAAGVCLWRRLRNLQTGFSQSGNHLLHLFGRAPLPQLCPGGKAKVRIKL